MDFEPQIGSLLEFSAGDDFRLAVVTGMVGTKKLVVRTVDDDEMRTTIKDVTFELGKASTDDLERALSKLRALLESVEARQHDVEVAMLWEFVKEEQDPLSAEDLAELMFADTEKPTVLALLRALRGDTVYFKARRDGLFEPRSEDQVAALREQAEARQRKEAERDRVLFAFHDLLALEPAERRTSTEERIGQDDGFRNAVHLLQDFAAFGEDYRRRDEAEALLDDLAQKLDRQLKGRLGLKAFHLMVDLGLWDEHYNLGLHRFRIDEAMPEAVLEEARRLAEKPFQPEDFREDLTFLTAVTIDAPSTRDIDDALSCQPTIEGGWELSIHIADPSAIVDIDTPLDVEARRRGTSVYLPTGTIPMFPLLLSDDRMSLVQGEVRPALTTRVVFDEELNVLHSEIVPSLVKVTRRLSYDEADELLESDAPDRIAETLHNLKYIADECYNRRVENGAFSFDLPETKIVVTDEEGTPNVSVDALATATPSRELVSELMILNNEIVGRFCARNDIPAIFRVQESPDDDLLDEEILAIPEGPARAFAQIRRMKSGDISTQAGLHFGLGVFHYAQASSPIRRYADLVCQRQIKAFITGQKLPYDEEAILEVLAAVGGAMGDASDVERDTQRYWLLYFLATKEEPLDAIVVEHKDDRGTRASVFLTDCAFRANCTLRTKVAVGDRVQVVVERAHPRHDSLTLRQA